MTYYSHSSYSHLKLPWARFITADTRLNASHEALDLLDRLLRYDHYERLTAAEALSHSYFSESSLSSPFLLLPSLHDRRAPRAVRARAVYVSISLQCWARMLIAVRFSLSL